MMKRTDDDNEWAALHPACWICGSSSNWMPLQIHEIVRRSQSSKALHRCNYFRTCYRCHDEYLASKATAPHAVQLAYKKIHDSAHYDLAEWYEIAGRPATYVTPEEVELCIKAIRLARIGF